MSFLLVGLLLLGKTMKVTIRDTEHYLRVTSMMESHFGDRWGYSFKVFEHMMFLQEPVAVDIILDDEVDEDGVVLMCVSLL